LDYTWNSYRTQRESKMSEQQQLNNLMLAFTQHVVSISAYRDAATTQSSYASTLNNNNNSKNDTPSLLIHSAASILYQLGQKTKQQATKGDNTNYLNYYESVKLHFQQMISCFSNEYLVGVILHDIHSSFITVSKTFRLAHIQHTDDKHHEEDLQKALQSLCGLHVYSMNSNESTTRIIQREGFDVELCIEMILIYQLFKKEKESIKKSYDNDERKADIEECILQISSSLLIYGLILPQKGKIGNDGNVGDDDGLCKIMNVVQELQSLTDTDNYLEDLQKWQELQQKRQNEGGATMTLVQAVESLFDADKNNDEHTVQKNYLLQMLQSSPSTTKDTTPTPPAKVVTANKYNNTSKTSALTKRVQTIQTIFPKLGEGYIEVALACYNHDVQQTIMILSSGEKLHPRLQVLDPSLPARKKESKSKYEALCTNNTSTISNKECNTSEKEALTIQKERFKIMEERQENQAYALSMALEYDDDYDDQYDGIGNDGGGADVGGLCYDVDLDAIRAYNKVAREMEDDRVYWEEMKNTNLQQDSTTISTGVEEEEQEKKYRGLDKGKKGRLIGSDGKYLPYPTKNKNKNKKGGKKDPSTDNNKDDGGGVENVGNTKSSSKQTALSKTQKRRKNDNKAKIANHHRKERSMKKNAM